MTHRSNLQIGISWTKSQMLSKNFTFVLRLANLLILSENVYFSKIVDWFTTFTLHRSKLLSLSSQLFCRIFVQNKLYLKGNFQVRMCKVYSVLQPEEWGTKASRSLFFRKIFFRVGTYLSCLVSNFIFGFRPNDKFYR